MITGSKKVELTPESILSKISTYDLFRYYIPDKTWKIGVAMNSCLHKDDNPSFLVGNRGGDLHFIDFSSNQKGDVFTFLKLLFGLDSMNDVLLKIDGDFGLGIGNAPVKDYKQIISQYQQPEELGKRYCLIQAITRKFTQEELKYWQQYQITIEELRANNIHSIKEMYLNKSRLSLQDLRFGYFYPNGGWWKLYQVNAPKKSKWLSNVPIDTAYGLENLDKDHNTLICKSLKDFMVCKLIYPYVCHVQNESLSAFSLNTISYLKEHSKEVFYGGDSDIPGKNASYAITELFGFKHINPPDELLNEGIKDFADWGRYKGLEEVKNHFIKKGLYGNMY